MGLRRGPWRSSPRFSECQTLGIGGAQADTPLGGGRGCRRKESPGRGSVRVSCKSSSRCSSATELAASWCASCTGTRRRRSPAGASARRSVRHRPRQLRSWQRLADLRPWASGSAGWDRAVAIDPTESYRCRQKRPTTYSSSAAERHVHPRATSSQKTSEPSGSPESYPTPLSRQADDLVSERVSA
jgi:hypothetical protein